MMAFYVILTVWATIVTHKRYIQRKKKALDKRRIAENQSSISSENSNLVIEQSFKPSHSKWFGKLRHPKCVRFYDKVLRSFSLKRNAKKLFSPSKFSKEDQELEVLNAFKVLSICLIVLGNTYYYTLKGPVQNLEMVYKLIHTNFFLLVFQANLQCDVFYWVTGFVSSQTMLKLIDQNQGFWWASPFRIQFERYFRLLPLYAFMICFVMYFVNLLGGSGPRFYQFEEHHSCGDNWFYHILMINNFIPWNQADYCLTDSWYIANDFWFMIFAMNMVETFLKSKKKFLVYSVLFSLLCFGVQLAQISHYNLSPSYLSPNNTYWDMYLRKPFPHFHSFSIGLILGCGYHAYKNDQLKQGSVIQACFQSIKESRVHGVVVFTIGLMIQLITCVLTKFTNNRADLGFAWNTMYLLFSRPLFTVGFSMMVLPLVLNNAQLV